MVILILILILIVQILSLSVLFLILDRPVQEIKKDLKEISPFKKKALVIDENTMNNYRMKLKIKEKNAKGEGVELDDLL